MNEWEWQLLEDKKSVEPLCLDGIEVKPGSRVRLKPKPGRDIMDIALTGKIAVVESLEEDYEGKLHVCVVVDDDPGRDIGFMRQPGHRFFYDSDEIELVSGDVEPGFSAKPRILIAGIGNIFLGDDAFGVEVARRLAVRDHPAEVRIADFGIRGYDLAYALLEGHETTILVDACPRGEAAGSVYLIEPDIANIGSGAEQNPADAHAMNPLSVVSLAKSMGGTLKKIYLVGCEPETLGAEEGQMGLSPSVTAAVEEAAKMIEALVQEILANESGN